MVAAWSEIEYKLIALLAMNGAFFMGFDATNVLNRLLISSWISSLQRMESMGLRERIARLHGGQLTIAWILLMPVLIAVVFAGISFNGSRVTSGSSLLPHS
jgi:hypothetical protein